MPEVRALTEQPLCETIQKQAGLQSFSPHDLRCAFVGDCLTQAPNGDNAWLGECWEEGNSMKRVCHLAVMCLCLALLITGCREPSTQGERPTTSPPAAVSIPAAATKQGTGQTSASPQTQGVTAGDRSQVSYPFLGSWQNVAGNEGSGFLTYIFNSDGTCIVSSPGSANKDLLGRPTGSMRTDGYAFRYRWSEERTSARSGVLTESSMDVPGSQEFKTKWEMSEDGRTLMLTRILVSGNDDAPVTLARL